MRGSSLFFVMIGAVACGGATATDLTEPSTNGTTTQDAGSGGTNNQPGQSGQADATANPNGGPGGTTTSLPCGSSVCALPTETCCARSTNSGFAFSCSKTSCNGGGGGGGDPASSLKCAATVNCASGQVCCAGRNNDALVTACAPSCEKTIQLCDPTAAVSGCPANRKCTSDRTDDLGLPASFGTCN